MGRKEHREVHLLCKYLGLQVIHTTAAHIPRARASSQPTKLQEEPGNVTPIWGATSQPKLNTIEGKHTCLWTYHQIYLPSIDNNNLLLTIAYFVPDVFDVLNIYICLNIYNLKYITWNIYIYMYNMTSPWGRKSSHTCSMHKETGAKRVSEYFLQKIFLW